MDLFDAISRRKSSRNYTQQPLGQEQLEEICEAIHGFERLYPDVPLEYRFVTKAKGLFKVQAPHYLIVSGQGKQKEAESAGFLFQQIVLWLSVRNIGSVWLGKTKAVEESDEKEIITIAFGQTNESVHRDEGEFKRKPIHEITNAPENVCIQAVRLAPSGMNLQPWYLEKSGDKVFVCKQSLKPPLSLVYKKIEVDMGIALCHYALACRKWNHPFVFHRRDAESAIKGYRLFGELDCAE